MKKYILYAGVNGAGKSILYQTTKYKEHMPRINTDEILREFGDWRNIQHFVGNLFLMRFLRQRVWDILLNCITSAWIRLIWQNKEFMTE